MHRGVEFSGKPVLGAESVRRSPPSAAELMHILCRNGRIILPFILLIIEEIDVPSRASILGDHVPSEHLARPVGRERVIKMSHPWVVKRGCNPFRGLHVVVESGHLNPDNAHTDVCVGVILQDRFEHRTGARDTSRSRRRKQGNKPILVFLGVKVILQRRDRISQGRQPHFLSGSGFRFLTCRSRFGFPFVCGG